MTLENQEVFNPTAAQVLLEQVREVARELHAGRSPAAITLDSSLEREAGIDSLGRMELLVRIERHFGVTLPDAVVFAAETPRDLLHALETARPATFAPPVPAIATPAPLGPMPGAPAQAATIPDLLDWHVEHHAEHPYIQLYAEDHSLHVMTYGDLVCGATRVAAGLQADGLHPGQTVALMLPTGRDYFYGFYGILLAGGIPVPMYPPHRRTQLEDHLRRQVAILSNAQAHWLITMPEAKRLAALLKSLLPELHDLVTVAELSARGGPLERIKSRSRDIAFLQYTSGSTGDPKGVVLTHENRLANLRAMGAVVQASASDCFVSWLPLYHDMGLIGACLGSLYYGMPLVLMSPLAFLARPPRWLWAIHQHRGTLSAAPNFAYEIRARRIPESELTGLDLSSWRVAFNGAEPVSPDTLAHFMERFRAYGFRPEAMTPVYGLAESSVGLAFPPLHRGPHIDNIQREAFRRQGRAEPAAGEDKNALRLVACGQPLPGHEIRIVDEADHELGGREIGHLQFRGPSATSGYYRNSRATQALFHDGWLDSSDLAYLADGEVYITGREKDLMIRAGRNLFPYELEQAIGDIPGIRRGCVAVFGSPDPASGTERVIILAETKETQPEKQAALRQPCGKDGPWSSFQKERLGEPLACAPFTWALSWSRRRPAPRSFRWRYAGHASFCGTARGCPGRVSFASAWARP